MRLNISSQSHLLSALEDSLTLDLPLPNLDLSTLNWVQYNPRKEIRRFAASITSLNGDVSGIPDLDSLREYNLIHNTHYKETDFNVLTPQGEPFKFLTDLFDLGRSHFIRLEPGGFFPYHRDLDATCFRIAYMIKNCSPTSLAWLQNDKVIKMQNKTWYYINTFHPHALFAFEKAEFAIFNIYKSDKSLASLFSKLLIR
jgi:hypothetical protein